MATMDQHFTQAPTAENVQSEGALQEEIGEGSYISLGAQQARQLQIKAKAIVVAITKEPLITSGWQFPLRAGPEAISIMATCLVASSRKDSKRIQLTATCKHTGKPLLPFTGLQTNLQWCSKLGRDAFDEAQKSMDHLQGISEFTIDANGTVSKMSNDDDFDVDDPYQISSIIGLLNSPEDARCGLRPELEELRMTASELQKKAEGMEKAFVAWLEFITALTTALTEQRDVDLLNQEEKNANESTQAQIKQATSTEMVQSLQKQIQAAEADLKRADADTDKAMSAYYEHLAQPPPREYSLAEVKAQLERPEEPLTDPGFFPSIKNFLFGKSDKAQHRDAKYLKDRMDEDAKRITEALREMTLQYEAKQKVYQEKVDSAEKNRLLFLERKQKAEKTYNEHVTKMFEASQTMNVAKANLDRSKSEKLELDVIRDILDTSSKQLTNLVQYIRTLKEFFTSLTKLVTITNERHVKFFLQTLESGIKNGGQARDAKIIKNIMLTDISKMKLLHSVLEIQARFSAVKDISSLYVDVSKRFIRPGITQMDSLALLGAAEYEDGLAKFETWLDESRNGISGMAQVQNREIEVNVRDSVDDMTRQAIEWW